MTDIVSAMVVSKITEPELEQLVRWMTLNGAKHREIQEVLFVLRSTEGPWYVRLFDGMVEIKRFRPDACGLH